MNRHRFTRSTIGLALLGLTACNGSDPMPHGGMMGGGMGMMNMSMARHQYYMHNGVDPAYAGKRNPLAANAANRQAGRSLYQQNCAACHGPEGQGDGVAGRDLNPPPSDIAALVDMPMATDDYLYWTLAEGGAPVGSAMPPFKASLSETQIWQLIVYLRAL